LLLLGVGVGRHLLVGVAEDAPDDLLPDLLRCPGALRFGLLDRLLFLLYRRLFLPLVLLVAALLTRFGFLLVLVLDFFLVVLVLLLAAAGGLVIRVQIFAVQDASCHEFSLARLAT